MRTFTPTTVARLQVGEIDYTDAVAFILDSGTFGFFFGGIGEFEHAGITYYGMGAIASLEVPEDALGPESKAITVRLRETYMVEGSDVPVNIFAGEVLASIDDEDWPGRPAILTCFWRDADGVIVEAEQVALRDIDSMYQDIGEDGLPIRVVVLEEPDIRQRDIEGKTRNAIFQAQIDPTDLAFEHAGEAVTQTISFGRRPEDPVT